MSAIGLKAIIGPNLDRAFDLAGEMVRDCVFYKTESSAGTGLVTMAALSAAVKALVGSYRSGDIDGTVVQVGDERLVIRAGELVSITSPGSGDYLIETVSAIRREVIAARLDPTGSFWTVQARRATGEDWGDLAAFTASEEWDDLATANNFDDWQT
jgi:hypothetical protein